MIPVPPQKESQDLIPYTLDHFFHFILTSTTANKVTLILYSLHANSEILFGARQWIIEHSILQTFLTTSHAARL